MYLEPDDDTTYSDVNIQFGNYFAYDPVQNPQNDVPSETTEIYGQIIGGRGLNLSAYAEGGTGIYQQPEGGWKGDYECGTTGGDSTGQIAMKFELINTDTLYGYQAFWCYRNSSEDDIQYSIYTDSTGLQPNKKIASSVSYKKEELMILLAKYNNGILFQPHCYLRVNH